MAHLNLGGILRARGDFAGSLAMLRRGHELGSKQPGWPHPSAWWVAEAERRAALAERLTVVLKGESSPKDNAERLDLARMCFDTRRFAAAARLSAEAMEIDPKLGEASPPISGTRPPVTTPPAPPPWLLSVRERTTRAPTRPPGTGSAPRPATGSAPTSGWARNKTRRKCPRLQRLGALVHLKECSDLAGFRDATALAKIPEAERKQWQSLWAEIDALFDICASSTQHDPGNEVESQTLCWTRPSPDSARRFDSIPITPMATAASATP